MLETVPDDRLLIVRTREIIDRIPEMARWAGVPEQTMRTDRAREYVTRKKHNVLSRLDASYVRETAAQHCGELMKRFFAEDE